MQSLNALLGGTVIPKQQLITEDTIWHRPEKMVGNTVWLTMIGGGQSGYASPSFAYGPSSGQYVKDWPVDIGDAADVVCTIGKGGVPTSGSAVVGSPTSFGEFLTVSGGSNSTPGSSARGGRGDATYNATNYGAQEASLGAAAKELHTGRIPGGGGLIIGPDSPGGASSTDSRGFGAGGTSVSTSASGVFGGPGKDGCILVKWLEYI